MCVFYLHAPFIQLPVSSPMLALRTSYFPRRHPLVHWGHTSCCHAGHSRYSPPTLSSVATLTKRLIGGNSVRPKPSSKWKVIRAFWTSSQTNLDISAYNRRTKPQNNRSVPLFCTLSTGQDRQQALGRSSTRSGLVGNPRLWDSHSGIVGLHYPIAGGSWYWYASVTRKIKEVHTNTNPDSHALEEVAMVKTRERSSAF